MSESTWVQLTADVAKTGLNKRERDGLARVEEFEPGASGTLDGIVNDLVAEVRLNISSSGRSRLSSDRSLIPQGLVPAAGDILRFRILTRFELAVSESRTKSWEAANALLQAVRRGEVVIPMPDGGPEQPDKTARPYYDSGRVRRWGPRATRGIM